MSFEFPLFFTEAAKDVRELSSSFLQENGLNYFQYGRFYQDNSSFHLVTHPDFVNERAKRERKVLSHIDSELIKRDTYRFFWNESLPLEDTNLAREFDLDKGLCFVDRKKDYYDLIAFAAPVKNNPLNFYLNNTGKLLRFIDEFRYQGASLFEEAYKKRFLIPTPYQDENKEKLFLNPKEKIPFFYQGVHFTLSRREYDCLKLFYLGYTLVKISEELKLSPRTVETYLNRVKSKAGLLSRSELQNFSRQIFSLEL